VCRGVLDNYYSSSRKYGSNRGMVEGKAQHRFQRHERIIMTISQVEGNTSISRTPHLDFVRRLREESVPDLAELAGWLVG
jgi:hypothetical protein